MAKPITGPAQESLGESLARVTQGRQRVVLRRGRRAVAALVPLEDLKALEALEDQRDLEDARRARQEPGGAQLEDFCRKHGLKL